MLKQRLKLLTEEKSDLRGQLMDCHLQIEQEGKVCGGVLSFPVESSVRDVVLRIYAGHIVYWSSFIVSKTSSFRFFCVMAI